MMTINYYGFIFDKKSICLSVFITYVMVKTQNSCSTVDKKINENTIINDIIL